MTKRRWVGAARLLWVVDVVFCLVGLWWWALLGVDHQAGAATIWTAILITVMAIACTIAAE